VAPVARRVATLTVLVGCQGALVGEEYRGAPIFSVRLPVQLAAEAERGAHYRAGLFFTTRVDDDDPEHWSELVGSSNRVEVPSDTLFNVYSAPLPSQFAEPGLALGRLLLYRDTNDNGRREKGESFVSITPSALFAYRENKVDVSILDRTLTDGFHVINVPQRCGVVLPPATESGTCGVPIGDPCRNDIDCHGGLCLKETKFPWPGGYCVVPARMPPQPGACIPSAATYLPSPKFSLVPPGVHGFYGRTCMTDADCARPTAREQIYICDLSLAVCMPPTGLVTAVGGRFEVEPICAAK
jgi:hypothetical protein